jgi:hypothetical protein
MLYPVYECDDFSWEDKILTIFKPKLIGMIRNHKDFNEIYLSINYNALVCPHLAKDENGFKPKRIVFV